MRPVALTSGTRSVERAFAEIGAFVEDLVQPGPALIEAVDLLLTRLGRGFGQVESPYTDSEGTVVRDQRTPYFPGQLYRWAEQKGLLSAATTAADAEQTDATAARQRSRVGPLTSVVHQRSPRCAVRMAGGQTTLPTALLQPYDQRVEHGTHREGDRHRDHQKNAEQPPEVGCQ